MAAISLFDSPGLRRLRLHFCQALIEVYAQVNSLAVDDTAHRLGKVLVGFAGKIGRPAGSDLPHAGGIRADDGGEARENIDSLKCPQAKANNRVFEPRTSGSGYESAGREIDVQANPRGVVIRETV